MARPIPSSKRWAAITLAMLGAARAARADDDPLIFYRGSPTCPDGDAFIDRVRSRTPRASLAREGAAARFVVTVSSSNEESVGRVEFAGPREANVVRNVSGKTCDEVVSATALITALAIEATAEPAPVPAAPTSADPGEASMKARATPEHLAAPRLPFAWGAGATVGIDGWSAPRAAYALGVFGEISGPTPLRLLRIGVRGAAGSAALDARSAAFLLLAGRLSLCPVSLELTVNFEVLPCAGIDVGRLAGEGQRSAALPEPRTAAIFWTAAEAELLIRWRTARVIVLEVGGELGFPLVRHNFIFEGPTQLIYEVPVFGAGLHVGAALHFR